MVNWINGHCNLVVVTDYLLMMLVGILWLDSMKDGYTAWSFLSMGCFISVLVLYLFQVSWMLKIKGQSQWNLLWFYAGWIGLIVWLCLKNKSQNGGTNVSTARN